MAPAAGGAQVDVHEEAHQPFWCSRRDPTTCAAHGRGKSDVGLYAHSGCSQESRAPDRAIDDRAHPKGPRSATRTDAPDVMADFSASTLGSHLGSRLLLDRGVDVARPCDVLHGV